MKQRDSPHRARAEITSTFLGVIFFSIGEMESREQRRFGEASFAQAARRCREYRDLLGIASRRKNGMKRVNERVEGRHSDVEGGWARAGRNKMTGMDG